MTFLIGCKSQEGGSYLIRHQRIECRGRGGEWRAAESTTPFARQMNANTHPVFWFSLCLGPFVSLNELNPTEFSAQLLEERRTGAGWSNSRVSNTAWNE